eukprot:COSAG05_NODE_905_length_6647_cov_42.260385_2_plen_92_part_00
MPTGAPVRPVCRDAVHCPHHTVSSCAAAKPVRALQLSAVLLLSLTPSNRVTIYRNSIGAHNFGIKTAFIANLGIKLGTLGLEGAWLGGKRL